MRRRHLLALFVAPLLAGCGGGKGAGTPAIPSVTPTVVVSPASVELLAGGSPVEFTASVTGSGAPITWSLDGPGKLSATSGPAVLYTPPDAVAAMVQVEVTAASGGGSGSARILLGRPAPVTVTGVILDPFGNPAPDITVSVEETTTISDANGRFSLSGVTPPYVLTAASAVVNEAVVYQGLTRLDPTIRWQLPVSGFNRRGEIVGTIDGGVPVDEHNLLEVVFGSPETQVQGEAIPPVYSLGFAWNGPEATTGSVHALEMNTPVRGGVPAAFLGYARQGEVTVLDGAAASAADLSLTPPAVGSIRGAWALPAGYTLLTKFLALGFDDGAFMALGFDDSQDLEFAYLLPSGIDAAGLVLVEATAPGVFVARRESGIAVGSSGLAFTVPEGSSIVSPADGAAMVDARTDLSWSPFPGGVFTVDISTARGPSFHVVTRSTSTRLPEIASLPLPAQTAYVWRVSAVAPFASIDEAAGPRGLNPAGNSFFASSSDARGFVTR